MILGVWLLDTVVLFDTRLKEAVRQISDSRLQIRIQFWVLLKQRFIAQKHRNRLFARIVVSE